MATSETGGFERFRSSNYDANHPASVHMTRSMVNNANHLADEDAQVLVADARARPARSIDEEWRLVWSWGFFPMKVSGGAPYPVRIRMNLSLASSVNVDVIVAVVAPGDEGSLFNGAGNVKATNPGLAYATISNTSATWITFAYPSGIANMLYPGREIFDTSTRRFSVPETIGGAKTQDVRITLGKMVLMARRQTAGSVLMAINAAYAAAYVGLE